MRTEIIGDCTLHLADCRDVLPTIGAWAVDAVVIDPPFGIGFAGQPTKWQRLAGQAPEAWDDESPNVSALITVAPVVVIWGGNYFPLPVSRGWQAWYKPDAPPSMGTVELAWTNQDRTAHCIVQSISATNPEREGHPTQKPIAVMRWSMDIAGVPSFGTVWDGYMGSGTTGVACVQTGRKFIGIEIEPKYFDIACRRIERAVREASEGLFVQPPSEVQLELGMAK